MGAMQLKGKQALVCLLKGPKDPAKLAKTVHMSGGYAVTKTLVRHGWVQVTSRGLMLTESGTKQAVQYEYDLKNRNSHPDQLVPKITGKSLAGGGAMDDTIVKAEVIDKGRAVAAPVDWQRHHVEFLERLCIELVKTRP